MQCVASVLLWWRRCTCTAGFVGQLCAPIVGGELATYAEYNHPPTQGHTDASSNGVSVAVWVSFFLIAGCLGSICFVRMKDFNKPIKNSSGRYDVVASEESVTVESVTVEPQQDETPSLLNRAIVTPVQTPVAEISVDDMAEDPSDRDAFQSWLDDPK
eukprot:SAG31_NODE_852_length_11515_cov_6.636125_6_plen_158_part_00